ncbi:AAA family ATPase [Phormidium tenue]|uniref:CobQ/CobB/MinD/ParA nucleotide binding domain-containing protein n=1 Tax=Phormidium tenue NIES-30 TaxID=549789 RepID=A0A1U7J1U3_9CYAN|nr:AAA family ATPase [Phormidium tenue]MBD2233654.1 AAA family ATPase [Phormidium tenue FACHB-1052]OKH46077.1 hypothetical protein NIES30_17390 [Phormidium tenue NIES-30]
MSNKTVNIINGAKGGTGKTLFARLLYATLDNAGSKVIGIDSDQENPEFSSFHADPERFAVPTMDCLSLDGGKNLVTMLSGEVATSVASRLPALARRCPADVVILDMPAASSTRLREQIDVFDLIPACGEMGYGVTIISVISTSYAPIESISRMLDFCGDTVRWVVVKNQYFASDGLKDAFSLWDESKERKRVKKYGGVEIELPRLADTTFKAMQANYTPFTALDSLPLGDKLLARSFVRRGSAQIEANGQLLGLPVPVAEAV